MTTLLAVLKVAAIVAGSVALVVAVVLLAMVWLLNHPPLD